MRDGMLKVLLADGRRAPALLPAGAQGDRLAAWLDGRLAEVGDVLAARRLSRQAGVVGLGTRIVEGTPDLLVGTHLDHGVWADLLAWSAPLREVQDWTRVLQRAVDAVPSARGVRVRLAGRRAPPVRTGRRVGHYLVAGKLRTIRSQARPWGEVVVDTRQVRDLRHHAAYRQALLAWDTQAGPVQGRLRPATPHTLQRCLDEGAVIGAYKDGAWAGLAAAHVDGVRGVHGYRVVAMFLDAPLRRQRKAAVLQRALAEALVDTGRDALWGLIDGRDMAALRTALRCGREVAETWWTFERA